MNPRTTKLLALAIFFIAILTTSNVYSEITCADYPDKDLIIILDESVNNVSTSEYLQTSALEEEWYISSSYDFTEDEVKSYINKQGVVMWTDYNKETFKGMHFQTIEAGNETIYILIEKFTEVNAAKRIYQQFFNLYDKATNVVDLKKKSELGIVGYGGRIKHDDYVIKFIDNNNRLIHISGLNMTRVEYVAGRYANLQQSLIVSEKNHWRARVCKSQTDACTQTFYFSSDYDKYRLVNCSTMHEGKKLPCPESRIDKFTSQMKIPFASCEKNDILDMVYEKTTEFPIKNKFWSPKNVYFQDVYPIEKSVLLLEFPKNIQVKKFSNGVEPVESTIENRTSYVWEKDSIKPFEYEDYMPPYSEVIQSASYTSLSSWDEVRTWFEGLFTGAENKDAVKNKVNEIIAGKTTDQEKSRAIYDWVRDQIRYEDSEMGFMTGYKPHSAGEVLNYKFGDCKDHSILLISMLDAAGIKAYPVLVSDRKISSDAPTPFEFYHSIVAIPQGGSYIWLDPTCKYCSYGFLSEGEQGSDVLMLSNPSGTFMKTPENDKDLNYQSIVNYTVNLRESGNAEIGIKLMKTGSYGLALKKKLQDSDRKTAKEDLEPIIQSVCSDYDLSDYKIINSSDEQAVVVEINVSCNNLASKSGTKTVYNIPSETLFSEVASKETREYPIRLETNDHMTINVELKIPEGLAVEMLPETYSSDSNFATYHFLCSNENGIVTCKREFNQKAIELPSSDFGKFKEFFGKINSQKRTIVLSAGGKTTVQTNKQQQTADTEAKKPETSDTNSEPQNGNTGVGTNLVIGGLVVLVLVLLAAVGYFATRKKK